MGEALAERGDLARAQGRNVTAIRLPSWREVFAGPWAMHLRAGATGLWLMRMEAEEVGRVVARFVAGTACATSRDLFDEFAAALEFPDHFGRNWDALDDSVHDLEWLPEGPLALLVSDANRLLADEPQRLATLLDILSNAERELREPLQPEPSRQRELRVVFQARELDRNAEAIFSEFGVGLIA